jgi:hypothetical protein
VRREKGEGRREKGEGRREQRILLETCNAERGTLQAFHQDSDGIHPSKPE